MSPPPQVVAVAAVLLTVATGLALFRVLRGPGLLDRIVAVDVLATLIVALTVIAAVRSGESSLIDVAIAVALVSFMATVAVARFVEERDRDD